MDLREVLDRALEAVSGNQAALARRLGKSETTVSRWVTGRNGIDFDSALRLAQVTGLPARQVVEACGLEQILRRATERVRQFPDRGRSCLAAVF